ncbi:GNAT family N-acetyltransferase [Streptomyces sp. NPDC051662]|uniref:GNAT family N-acetyltransferase n=1 Tax=Streptomyces sp. NPDC051662 TaxID=3154750 RepID=UPI00342BDF08
MKDVYVLHAGAVSASLLLDPTGNQPAILSEVAVRPDDQGQGWGSEILRMVCAEADAEAITLMLSVDPGPYGLSYEALRAWYGRHGFVGDSSDDVMIRVPHASE